MPSLTMRTALTSGDSSWACKVIHWPPPRSCPGEISGDTAKNGVEVGAKPFVHPIVDDWIDTGIGHGQPVEAQVDVVNVRDLGDGWIVVGVQEVDVVGSPANHEDCHDHSKHLH